MATKNSYNKGILNFIMYPTPEGTFVAACQELCLIVEGKDQELLKYKIIGKAQSYIRNVCTKKLGEHLLNQELPKEILKEFNDYRAKKSNEDFQKWIESFKKLKENNKNLHTLA
ncbi:hypothetical protein IT413_00685 [Candidatus Peregrinibacteria bacterium]|nr:hypothetical protein [Candidatus Peregrinibacteria bacterium]